MLRRSVSSEGSRCTVTAVWRYACAGLLMLLLGAANRLSAQEPALQPPEQPSQHAADLPDDETLPPPA
jgi:hypothetical protein